jgi:hypothetical protein
LYFWNKGDVIKFLKRLCNEYGDEYAELFLKHEINGRALLRLNDNSLKRMGITDDNKRELILKEILKQKLKTYMIEIRDLELMNNNVYENCFNSNSNNTNNNN